MNDNVIYQLRELINELRERNQCIDEIIHNEHHEWIKCRIEAEKSKQEMYKEITKSVLQWSIFGILGGLLYLVQQINWPKIHS